MLVPPSLMTLGLFEWEIPRLKYQAASLSINIQIKPSMVVWDEISRNALTTMWNLEHDDCPFFSEERVCRIYENRPLICQAFPLTTAGLLSHVAQRRPEPLRIGYGTCPSIPKVPFPENKPLLIGSRGIFKELLRAFGDVFIGSIRYEFASIMVRDYLLDAGAQGKIRLGILKKDVVKSILRSKPIGLLLSKAEMSKALRSIENLTAMNLREKLGVN
jgi:Fe-S-cluster containining protein